MFTTKSLIAAALLSGFAAVSFAQSPTGSESPQPVARHHAHHHRHHHGQHGHRHLHHHHHAAPHAGR